MTKLIKLLAWTIAIILLAVGVMFSIDGGLGGPAIIIAGIITLPPVSQRLKGKLNTVLRYLITIILVVVGLITAAENSAKDKIAKNGPEIIQNIEQLIEAGDYDKAYSEALSYSASENEQILELKAKAERLKSKADKQKIADAAANKTAAIEQEKRQQAQQQKQQVQAQLDRLVTLDSDDTAGLHGVYQELAKLEPENKQYQQLNEKFTRQFEAMKVLMEISKLDPEARKEKFRLQFSVWSGAHRRLEKLIKTRLNDPDSYEHDQTRYIDHGDYLQVFTTYRAKNGFGGMVRESVVAKVSLLGEVLEVAKQ